MFDVHTARASEDFGVPPEAVTKDQRRVAKALGFHELYSGVTTKPPRFMVRATTNLNHVYDTVLQIEVFVWYGPTGEAKCNAVANALNELGHDTD